MFCIESVSFIQVLLHAWGVLFNNNTTVKILVGEFKNFRLNINEVEVTEYLRETGYHGPVTCRVVVQFKQRRRH